MLHELAPRRSAALMRARLGGSDVAEDVVQLVYLQSAGNPFFIEVW